MDAKKLIGLHIDANALNLTVATEQDAERVVQTLNASQLRHCRRHKHFFSLLGELPPGQSGRIACRTSELT